jgi:hypothetical protein
MRENGQTYHQDKTIFSIQCSIDSFQLIPSKTLEMKVGGEDLHHLTGPEINENVPYLPWIVDGFNHLNFIILSIEKGFKRGGRLMFLRGLREG